MPAAVHSANWMVVTANRYASQAAADMLKRGGSAVDAAIAAQWVLNVVEPQSSGIGGGGFMLTWHQSTQALRAYDGRETAPKALRADDFRGEDGKPLPFPQIVREGKAVGVPGLVALMAHAHQQMGRLPWASLFEPAIRIAEQGFFVSPRLHALLVNDRLLRDDPHAAELYYPGDQPLAVDQHMRNPALAQTFRKLASSGARAFYEGDIPRQIIAGVKARTGTQPALSEQDFRDYRVTERAAVCAPVLKREVCSMPPPSAGGIAVLQMLALLELQTEAPALRLSTPASDASKPALLTLENGKINWQMDQLAPWLKASRLAYEDRLRFVGDPDRVDVPVARLISRDYLRQRLGQFSLAEASPPSPERPATTHLSIVDVDGNAVSLTTSIEDQFGSRIMVGGFLLNNQLTDFDIRAADDPRPNPNAPEAGKRPRSSMAPTLVLEGQQANRRVSAVVGSPGGPQIPSFVASRLFAHWWGQQPLERAVAAPHITLRENRLDIEAGQLRASQIEALRQVLPAGQARDQLPVNLVPQTSGVHWIVRTPEGWTGVADPRREGRVIGE